MYRDVSVEVVLQALNVMSRLQNTVDGLDRYLGQVLQVWCDALPASLSVVVPVTDWIFFGSLALPWLEV